MPEEANEDQQFCCCAVGGFITIIIRLQIVGCVLRIIVWSWLMFLMSGGIHRIDQGIQLVPDDPEQPTQYEIDEERYLYVAVLMVASGMTCVYLVGLILGAVYFRDPSNKVESIAHLKSWHMYAASSLFFSMVFDLILIKNTYGVTIIFIILTISLNASTIKAMKMQRERLRLKEVLELSVHLTEENLD